MRTGPPTSRAKEQQIRHWNTVAPGWADWFEWTERNFSPLTAWLRDATGWEPGARLLDVACGAGYPALAAAVAARPGGRVVAIDISLEMLAAAARRAADAAIDNVDFLEGDADQLSFDDNSFDGVTNAYGLMFSADPERAVREAHRVLKPGGRLALVTWHDPSTSPFFSIAGGAAARFLALPPPAPMTPGPFRFARTDALETMLNDSGFSSVHIEARSMTFECASAAQYFQIFTDLAWKSRIVSLSEAEVSRFRDAVVEAARPFLDGDRLHLAATSLCASGRKSSAPQGPVS